MARNVFTSDRSQKECKIARFYRVGTRDWWFCTLRSAGLDSTGPLGLSPQGHDPDTYVRDRLTQVMRSVPKDMFRESEDGGPLLKTSRL
ncbi:fatty acyl-CoA reductase 2 [Apiospora rasikravindrae]|uniref:Fatty acyl-CoA reductase 2 n=1 Tax=Apiospora rasikravindrae TaxID=990691 RepID=A0ABR1SC87_9PEZI